MDVKPGFPSAASSGEEVERFAAALQDETRRRILLTLLEDGAPHTVDDVASLAGVHRTVAFTHLERLAGLGLLSKQQRRGRPGKPAALYAARAGFVAMSYPARQFQLLAALLGSGLSALGVRGSRSARERGRAYASQLAHPRTTDVAVALSPLACLGASYHVDGDDIETDHCVFREVCDEARDVVCSLHAGMLEGALGGAGIEGTVAPRGPVSERGCHFSLTRAGSGGR